MREFLRVRNFQILNEDMILEDGKYYPMMKVSQQKAAEQTKILPQEVADAFGPVLLQKRHPVLKEWLERELRTTNSVIEQLSAQPDHERIRNRMQQVNCQKNVDSGGIAKIMEQKVCSLTIRGETKQYPLDTTFQQIADEYQKQFENKIVLVKFQNDLKELSQSVLRDGSLEFVTADQKPGKDTYRRSLTLLMETAAWKLYPNLELLVQHSIGQGYYCEFRHKDAICVPDRKMLSSLKEKMQDFVKADLPIIKYNMNTQDASARFREMGRMDKVRLMRYRRSSRVNVYELQGFPDYYYGYMVPSTGYLEYFDLLLYQNGFMLMFPGKDPKVVAEFSASDKLFNTLNDSAQWGIDMGIRTVGELNDVIASGRIQDMILVQESYMEQKIGDIAETIASDRRKKFVLIAGPSSSGKTTFSHRLSIQMTAHGLKPHPISLDDFYCNREETPLDENGEF